MNISKTLERRFFEELGLPARDLIDVQRVPRTKGVEGDSDYWEITIEDVSFDRVKAAADTIVGEMDGFFENISVDPDGSAWLEFRLGQPEDATGDLSSTLIVWGGIVLGVIVLIAIA